MEIFKQTEDLPRLTREKSQEKSGLGKVESKAIRSEHKNSRAAKQTDKNTERPQSFAERGVPKKMGWDSQFDVLCVGDGSEHAFRFAAEIWTKDGRLVAEVSQKRSLVETHRYIEEDAKLFTKQELDLALEEAKQVVLSWVKEDEKTLGERKLPEVETPMPR